MKATNLRLLHAETFNYLKQNYILSGKIHKISKFDVMVNFMCQPDWATGCPDV